MEAENVGGTTYTQLATAGALFLTTLEDAGHNLVLSP